MGILKMLFKLIILFIIICIFGISYLIVRSFLALNYMHEVWNNKWHLIWLRVVYKGNKPKFINSFIFKASTFIYWVLDTLVIKYTIKFFSFINFGLINLIYKIFGEKFQGIVKSKLNSYTKVTI